ncbi:sulfotransferase family protein [Jannaschia seohaensis]|uniref:Sulfotransferase family protein n=1 Tax=Jannaschia seohaensis TaxID=475081 RepID=A0A2Y9AUR3_9RHOB|nr:sulfotransferase [Jannaschia seohaensis]PWJ17547.1 sulfotransferase family protein [Jannaschia seohaensis]SSA47695.1 Sulfotransferase family protein [Jannaschia seohaensis]
MSRSTAAAQAEWLPDLFICGVPKAGTSAVHAWLCDHPDVVGARDKEACFFVDPDSHIYRPEANVRSDWEAYRQQFDLPGDRRPAAILDSTPAYIYQETALRHIPDLATAPRCIFILRDPAEQIRSLYGYYRNNWSYIPEAMSFEAYVAALHAGGETFGGNELARDALGNADYLRYLRRWRAALGEERMFVATFDTLRRDPRGFMQDLADWIGLERGFYDGYAFATENETYRPRSRALQRLNIAVRARLPKGRAYHALRKVYRKLNARPGGEEVAADTLATLREEFAPGYAALEREFGLDLSAWRGAVESSPS